MGTNNNDTVTNVKNIVFPKCCDSLSENLTISLDDSGKLLVVDVTLKNVLCNKTMAIGVLVFEGPILQGFKVKEIYTGCCNCGCLYRNIKTDPYYFVLPDKEKCLERKVCVKVISNYTNINC